MTQWPSVKVVDIAAPKKYAINGGAFGSKLVSRDYVSSGVPVIRGVNLSTDGMFSFENFVYVSDVKADELLPNNAHPGDLVFTQRGTLGQVGLIPKECDHERFVVSQSQMKLTVDESKASSYYVYLYFRSPTTIQKIENYKITSGIPHINLSILKNFEIPLPPLSVQRRIADILSAYDDLIDNNNQRIALLEESIHLLYKEWFVHLKFPGHERVAVVDGIPEGWEKKNLADICESVRYGYTTSASQEAVGPKFLRITDIVPSILDWSKVPYCSIPEDKKNKYLLKEGDVVVARTGATVGYAKRIHKKHPEAVFASYLVRLRFSSDIDNMLLGTFIESKAYKGYIKANVGGAAQPNANAKVISGAVVLIPPQKVQEQFRGQVEPLFDQKELLQQQNQKLREARDRLLPRLMNGSITV